MNNGKYHTDQYRLLQEEKNSRRFGPIVEHCKICANCGSEFIWIGREFTKEFSRVRFCSKSCSNSRKHWWDNNATQYRTIAFKNWPKECAICKFDKIVAVHHLDENHNNNDPMNLIPLCPNHHEMIHSRWKTELEPIIDELLKTKWGISSLG